MDIKNTKISSIIEANTLIEMLKDVIDNELDKGEQHSDFPYVDLAVELNEILSLYIEMTDKRL